MTRLSTRENRKTFIGPVHGCSRDSIGRALHTCDESLASADAARKLFLECHGRNATRRLHDINDILNFNFEAVRYFFMLRRFESFRTNDSNSCVLIGLKNLDNFYNLPEDPYFISYINY